MPLIGDARRRRVLDRLKAQREAEQLRARVGGINLAIQKAKRNHDSFGRMMTVARLREELSAVQSDLAAASAREHSARRDLGET